MHDAQTRMRLVVAPTRACTARRFTFQRRLVTLCAWLIRFPNCGFLPQISHCCAMTAVDPFGALIELTIVPDLVPCRQFVLAHDFEVHWLGFNDF